MRPCSPPSFQSVDMYVYNFGDGAIVNVTPHSLRYVHRCKHMELVKQRKKHWHNLIKRICIVCIVKQHYCITYTIQVIYWLYNMPICICDNNNNNNKNDDDILYMYTTLLQVIFATCVQRNSTEKKNKYGHLHLGSKNLGWMKQSNTSSE